MPNNTVKSTESQIQESAFVSHKEVVLVEAEKPIKTESD